MHVGWPQHCRITCSMSWARRSSARRRCAKWCWRGAIMSGGADRQTVFLFWTGSVSRQSRKGAQNGFLASIRRRRPRGGLADFRRVGTPPARRPMRRRRYSARAVKVRRRPRSPNSAAPACQLAATPPWLACWIRHHRPCPARSCVPPEYIAHELRPRPLGRHGARPPLQSSSSASSRCLRARRRSSQPPS